MVKIGDIFTLNNGEIIRVTEVSAYAFQAVVTKSSYDDEVGNYWNYEMNGVWCGANASYHRSIKSMNVIHCECEICA